MTIYQDETDRMPAVNDRICMDLAEHSYEVIVQDGLLDRIGEFLVPFKLGPQTVVEPRCQATLRSPRRP